MKKFIYTILMLILLVSLFADANSIFITGQLGESQFIEHQSFIYEFSYLKDQLRENVISIYKYDNNNNLVDEQEIQLSDYFDLNEIAIRDIKSTIFEDQIILLLSYNSNENIDIAKITILEDDFELDILDFTDFGPFVDLIDEMIIFSESTSAEKVHDYQLVINSNIDTNNTSDKPLDGKDLINGKIHSNGTIALTNNGNFDFADNDGWPNILGDVSIVDDFIEFPDEQGNISEIISGEIETNTKRKDVNFNKNQLVKPFMGAGDEDIALLEFSSDGILLISGNVLSFYDEVEVYDEFPYDENGTVGNIIGGNQFIRKDTLWSPVASLDNNFKFHFDQEVWVKGVVSGNYIISSGKKIKIIDDITYANTPVGEIPTSDEDHLLLYCDKNIEIGYGHMDISDPSNPVRVKPNCDGVNIYATIVTSMNQDDFHNGVFTYEYPDPQPANEYWHEFYPGTDSSYIIPYSGDFHRYFFDNWPANVALPYRNPLYPEANPTYDRGDLNFYGSHFVNRIGFMQSSGSDPYHHDEGVWDLENYQWGADSQPNGYNVKNHFVPVPDNAFYNSIIQLETPEIITRQIIDLEANQIIASIASDNPERDFIVTKTNSGNYYFFDKNENILMNYSDNHLEPIVSIQNFVDFTGGDNLYYIDKIGSTHHLYMYDGETITSLFQFEENSSSENIELLSFENGKIAIVQSYLENETHNIDVYSNLSTEYFVEEIFSDEFNPSYQNFDVEFSCSINSQNEIDIVYELKHCYNTSYYRTTIGLEETNSDQAPELIKTSLNIYPSPFSISNSRNSGTNIDFSINKSQKVSIDVYNLKGQKVNTLTNNVFDKGHHSIVWNGENSNNNVVSTGVYFVRLKTERQSMVKKVLLLK